MREFPLSVGLGGDTGRRGAVIGTDGKVSGGGAGDYRFHIARMPPDQIATPPAVRALGLIERELTGRVIGTFFDVYNELGFGFLESIYARAMEFALMKAGMPVEREFPACVYFRGQPIGHHRVDMLIERRLVIEIKASDVLPSTARRQLRNYLCALRLDVGLILHFGPEPEFQRMVGRR